MRVLTFDVEDWFHILDNVSTRTAADWETFTPRLDDNVARILDCLARHSQKATFFCLGWIARRHPSALRAICDCGHQIGSHSDMHQLVYEQSPHEFEVDLKTSMDALQQASGRKVRLYRAPGFSITAATVWAFEKLVEAGIEVDSSVFPAARAHGGLPQWPISGPAILETPAGMLKVFPMNVRCVLGHRLVFSGGGYFRLMPGFLLDRLFEGPDYLMTYFHPRDFDPDQPVLRDLRPLRQFKSYVGLSGAMKKLERVLTRFDFLDLETAEAQTDWRHVKRLRVDASGRAYPLHEPSVACT